MGSMRFLITLAIIAPPALATSYVVGDDKGWTIKFDYQAWAQGKEFHVGDKLIFKYPEGVHNVFKVNGTAFEQCSVPPANGALTTGNDVITLSSTGRKWYISGVAKHCQVGKQKLFITVMAQSASPESAAPGNAASTYYGLMVALFGILFLVMV